MVCLLNTLLHLDCTLKVHNDTDVIIFKIYMYKEQKISKKETFVKTGVKSSDIIHFWPDTLM